MASGYATTVFRAQGASIKGVYIFSVMVFSGMYNSYVALSRHVEELKLYAIEEKVLVGDASNNYINSNYELHNIGHSSFKENKDPVLGRSYA